MRGILGVAALAVAGLACSTTQVVQRGGCWVRHTESFPKVVHEEVGICAKPPPQWSNDRVPRLVQECMAEADFRWQNEALEAWNAGKPLPPQRSEHELMQYCMNQAGTLVVTENEELKKRVAELSAERDAARAEAAQDRDNLRDSQSRMTDALGEAAKRPAPNAFATSNSSGTANTTSDQRSAAGEAAPTIVPVPIFEAPSPSKPAPAAKKTRVELKDPPALCNVPGAAMPQSCEHALPQPDDAKPQVN